MAAGFGQGRCWVFDESTFLKRERDRSRRGDRGRMDCSGLDLGCWEGELYNR